MGTHLLKHKLDTKDVLINFIRTIQNRTQKKIKMIRHDDGMEFHIPDFLNKHGIIHKKSCSYTPGQNVVEINHRTFIKCCKICIYFNQNCQTYSGVLGVIRSLKGDMVLEYRKQLTDKSLNTKLSVKQMEYFSILHKVQTFFFPEFQK